MRGSRCRVLLALLLLVFFFFQAEDGIRDFCLSRGLGDVYKRQIEHTSRSFCLMTCTGQSWHISVIATDQTSPHTIDLCVVTSVKISPARCACSSVLRRGIWLPDIHIMRTNNKIQVGERLCKSTPCHMWNCYSAVIRPVCMVDDLSLIHIWRCRRIERCGYSSRQKT